MIILYFLNITFKKTFILYCDKYVGWLISKVSYQVVSLVVGGKKCLCMRSVVDTV